MHLLDAPLMAGGAASGIVRETEIPGMVSEFDERAAAGASAIPWTTWETMDRGDRIMAVAFSRMQQLVEIHRDDAAAREMKRKNASA
jgi:hypothetical protein